MQVLGQYRESSELVPVTIPNRVNRGYAPFGSGGTGTGGTPASKAVLELGRKLIFQCACRSLVDLRAATRQANAEGRQELRSSDGCTRCNPRFSRNRQKHIDKQVERITALRAGERILIRVPRTRDGDNRLYCSTSTVCLRGAAAVAAVAEAAQIPFALCSMPFKH